ncbi:MAG: PmoA family protein [Bryobacterales bacterium]|nr:PmoA family protein [Bryobacterales bacterium]
MTSLFALLVAAYAGELRWVEKSPSVLELHNGGKLAFAYNHGSGRACCYVHPLVSPAGVTLTHDGPADHLHHRGLFWGWPIVEVAGKRYDTWLQRGVTHVAEGVAHKISGGKAELRARHQWRADGNLLLRDALTIATADGQTLDITLRLEAGDRPVTLAGAPEQDKGYGGLSVRFAPRSQTVLRSSEGAVPKDEDHGAHEWAEFEGSFASGRAGLRMTADRANPGFPHHWCLRHYGFTGANFPGVTPVRLEPGKPVTLRYQVRLFDAQDHPLTAQARENGRRFERSIAAMRRLLHAWLAEADPKTGLLPERLPGGRRGLKEGQPRRYTSHNSGADLYPYLILTAELTDPDLYRGRMLDMLRNEVRYATVKDGLPGDVDLSTGKVSPVNLFGAAEYAKDGLLAVTELLGRTPWFYRMADLTAALMQHAPVETRFGRLPGPGAEINGDVLQVLVRLMTMTGDSRYREWAHGIARAYLEEVLPGCHNLPCMNWDFASHRGDGKVQLRDHGNETVVGLTLLYAIDRTPAYREPIERMLHRVLQSSNPDGMLYDAIDPATLKPLRERLSDNWGYLYGAMYTYYQATGDPRYRDAVRRVLDNLPKYRRYDWEDGSFDGIADSVESALYLVNREPSPSAWQWIDGEMDDLLARQLPSGLVEYWYGEGNFNRTTYLYALAKSEGCRPAHWTPGLELGAVRFGDGLLLTVNRDTTVRFDFARHRRVLNLPQNFVRLNEFPEWFTVDENALYRLTGAGPERVLLGSELIAGVPFKAGVWEIAPQRK